VKISQRRAGVGAAAGDVRIRLALKPTMLSRGDGWRAFDKLIIGTNSACSWLNRPKSAGRAVSENCRID
jgi:hypothetical protein